jgi:hypothetical protein
VRIALNEKGRDFKDHLMSCEATNFILHI